MIKRDHVHVQATFSRKFPWRGHRGVDMDTGVHLVRDHVHLTLVRALLEFIKDSFKIVQTWDLKLNLT